MTRAGRDVTAITSPKGATPEGNKELRMLLRLYVAKLQIMNPEVRIGNFDALRHALRKDP